MQAPSAGLPALVREVSQCAFRLSLQSLTPEALRGPPAQVRAAAKNGAEVNRGKGGQGGSGLSDLLS